jgi:uncharacterized protein DUF6916
MKSLADLAVTDFEPRKGETFRLRAPDRELELELVQVKRLGESGRAGGAFSLLLRGQSGPYLPQAIYALDHPALGTMELFIVPIGPAAGGNGYEIIFT